MVNQTYKSNGKPVVPKTSNPLVAIFALVFFAAHLIVGTLMWYAAPDPSPIITASDIGFLYKFGPRVGTPGLTFALFLVAILLLIFGLVMSLISRRILSRKLLISGLFLLLFEIVSTIYSSLALPSMGLFVALALYSGIYHLNFYTDDAMVYFVPDFFLMRLIWFIAIGLAVFVVFKPTNRQQKTKEVSVAPGWYPDSSDPSRNRYWNGSSWQDETTPQTTGTTLQQQPMMPYQQPYAHGVMPSPSTYAIVSLVTAFFMPILAVIFGHLAKGEIRRSRGMKTGDGMATAGLILGYLGIAGIVLWIILIVTAVSQTQY